MSTKSKRKTLPMITLLRGGFGHIETGRILATRTTTHTVGGQSVTLARHIVQMDNAAGPFGASVRFVFNQSMVVEIGRAA